MSANVSTTITPISELSRTLRTLIRLLTSMCAHMSRQVMFLHEPFVALHTGEAALSTVNALVAREVTVTSEAARTVGTGEDECRGGVGVSGRGW